MKWLEPVSKTSSAPVGDMRAATSSHVAKESSVYLRLRRAQSSRRYTSGFFARFPPLASYVVNLATTLFLKPVLLSLFFIFSPTLLCAQPLQDARALFHKAISDEDFLVPAREAFEKIKSERRELVEMYIATLVALEAKHAFSPLRKWNKAQEALALMDHIVERNPSDAEIRFLRLSTTFYLPFFFERGEQSKQDASTLAVLLPADTKAPQDIRINARDFLVQTELLTPEEIALLCKSEPRCPEE